MEKLENNCSNQKNCQYNVKNMNITMSHHINMNHCRIQITMNSNWSSIFLCPYRIHYFSIICCYALNLTIFVLEWLNILFHNGKVKREINLFFCIKNRMSCITVIVLSNSCKSRFMIQTSCLYIIQVLSLFAWMMEAIFQSSFFHSPCQFSLISSFLSQHSSTSMQTFVLLWKVVQT